MDENHQPIPKLSRYPDPAVTYSTHDGDAEIREANDAFRAAFGPVHRSDHLGEILDAVATDRPPLTEFGQVSVTVSRDGDHLPVRYHGRIVPPADEQPGLVLFVRDETTDAVGVDSVASIVSHDLRNPLDVAKERLRAGRAAGRDEHFDHVERAHERMERIIDDVLMLARGETVIDPAVETDLNGVVDAAWETVVTGQSLWQPVDAGEATMEMTGPLPTVSGDSDRLARLFENLFRNALEHGGSDVTVRVGPLPDGNGLFVADDGPGIPESDRDSVFEPGYSSSDHGTGLGLAIVGQIAGVHGWTVTVSESASGGTRFELAGLESSS